MSVRHRTHGDSIPGYDHPDWIRSSSPKSSFYLKITPPGYSVVWWEIFSKFQTTAYYSVIVPMANKNSLQIKLPLVPVSTVQQKKIEKVRRFFGEDVPMHLVSVPPVKPSHFKTKKKKKRRKAKTTKKKKSGLQPLTPLPPSPAHMPLRTRISNIPPPTPPPPSPLNWAKSHTLSWCGYGIS